MITGRCMCGAVRYESADQMLWAMLCHCEDCQRAAGADYVSWFGMPRAGVNWDGPRRTFKSSEKVARSFCDTCGTPMSFETEILPEETHLYAPSLDDRSLYRPTAHIYWSEHVPWIEAAPDLPRNEKGLQNAVTTGNPLI